MNIHLGTSKEKHSFTCYFLYGTVIAHKVKARLPSERGVNYNPGEHILLLDVDNCSKILRVSCSSSIRRVETENIFNLQFLETYVPPNVDIYGFCAAGYLHVTTTYLSINIIVNVASLLECSGMSSAAYGEESTAFDICGSCNPGRN